ncbi:MAG: hypothetical protein KAI66_14420, partial [Lentisphaeria bacterium]|nr:hypothetical protein [Lentisphaeria bacterium]
LRGWITDKGGVKRPLLTAQPDHPTPDRQLTEGFTIEAFRTNDEYGLITRKDDSRLPVANAVTIEFGLPPGTDPASLVLRWTGSNLTLADAPAKPTTHEGEQRCPISAQSIVDQVVRVRLDATGTAAALDWIGLDVTTNGAGARWRAPDGIFREYEVESDHARPDNLVQNPAVTEDSHWTGGLVNRPFRRELGPIRFNHEKDPRFAEIPAPGPLRPFDIVIVSGSKKGSDGRYGIRNRIDASHFRMRRRSKGDEAGLTAELVHNDGTPLVPGGCCLELRGEDTIARQTIKLPPNADKLRFSFLLRVMDAARLGTRDIPEPMLVGAELVFTGQDAKTILRTPLPIPKPSYQWRKYGMVANVPKGCTAVTCEFRGVADGAATLVTGMFLAPATVE